MILEMNAADILWSPILVETVVWGQTEPLVMNHLAGATPVISVNTLQ